MAAVVLCEESLAELKNSIRDDLSFVKSSHLSEALAAGMGYQTNAALQAALVGPQENRPFVLLNGQRFVSRLAELGYTAPRAFDFEQVLRRRALPGVVSTQDKEFHSIKYASQRQRAWRNLLVVGINAGLEQGVFSLRVGDQRHVVNGRGRVNDFILPTGHRGRGYVSDAGCGELNISVAFNPVGDRIPNFQSRTAAAEAVASSWIERELGAWLQSSTKLFTSKLSAIPVLASIEIEAAGYGDRGHVIM